MKKTTSPLSKTLLLSDSKASKKHAEKLKQTRAEDRAEKRRENLKRVRAVDPAATDHLRLLNVGEAAALINMSEAFMRKCVLNDTGPKVTRVGRSIRFRICDLIDFTEGCAK
jgi:hypothetical protein